MLLSPAIEEFVRHLKCDRRLSPATVDSWRPIVRAFAAWCVADADESAAPDYAPSVAELNPLVLKRYFRYLIEARSLRPRTVKAHRCALRQFWDYLQSEGAVPAEAPDPFAGLRLPRLDAAQRALVSDEEGWACLDACERIARPKPRALARALYAVLCYAALRRAELIALDLADVNYTEQSITVRHGKGDKRRTIYPAPELFAALREWETFRPRPCEHAALFAWDSRRRLHEDGLLRILADVAAIAGYAGAPNIKPHSLRHWCATRLYQTGKYTLEDMRLFLGHESIQTTAIYLHSDAPRMKKLAVYGSRHLDPETGPIVRPESAAPVSMAPPVAPEEPEPRRSAAWRRKLIERDR